eukprot:14134-Heterococcus_DN1.PRE.1
MIGLLHMHCHPDAATHARSAHADSYSLSACTALPALVCSPLQKSVCRGLGMVRAIQCCAAHYWHCHVCYFQVAQGATASNCCATAEVLTY